MKVVAKKRRWSSSELLEQRTLFAAALSATLDATALIKPVTRGKSPSGSLVLTITNTGDTAIPVKSPKLSVKVDLTPASTVSPSLADAVFAGMFSNLKLDKLAGQHSKTFKLRVKLPTDISVQSYNVVATNETAQAFSSVGITTFSQSTAPTRLTVTDPAIAGTITVTGVTSPTTSGISQGATTITVRNDGKSTFTGSVPVTLFADVPGLRSAKVALLGDLNHSAGVISAGTFHLNISKLARGASITFNEVAVLPVAQPISFLYGLFAVETSASDYYASTFTGPDLATFVVAASGQSPDTLNLAQGTLQSQVMSLGLTAPITLGTLTTSQTSLNFSAEYALFKDSSGKEGIYEATIFRASPTPSTYTLLVANQQQTVAPATVTLTGISSPVISGTNVGSTTITVRNDGVEAFTGTLPVRLFADVPGQRSTTAYFSLADNAHEIGVFAAGTYSLDVAGLVPGASMTFDVVASLPAAQPIGFTYGLFGVIAASSGLDPGSATAPDLAMFTVPPSNAIGSTLDLSKGTLQAQAATLGLTAPVSLGAITSLQETFQTDFALYTDAAGKEGIYYTIGPFQSGTPTTPTYTLYPASVTQAAPVSTVTLTGITAPITTGSAAGMTTITIRNDGLFPFSGTVPVKLFADVPGLRNLRVAVMGDPTHEIGVFSAGSFQLTIPKLGSGSSMSITVAAALPAAQPIQFTYGIFGVVTSQADFDGGSFTGPDVTTFTVPTDTTLPTTVNVVAHGYIATTIVENGLAQPIYLGRLTSSQSNDQLTEKYALFEDATGREGVYIDSVFTNQPEQAGLLVATAQTPQTTSGTVTVTGVSAIVITGSNTATATITVRNDGSSAFTGMFAEELASDVPGLRSVGGPFATARAGQVTMGQFNFSAQDLQPGAVTSFNVNLIVPESLPFDYIYGIYARSTYVRDARFDDTTAPDLTTFVVPAQITTPPAVLDLSQGDLATRAMNLGLTTPIYVGPDLFVGGPPIMLGYQSLFRDANGKEGIYYHTVSFEFSNSYSLFLATV